MHRTEIKAHCDVSVMLVLVCVTSVLFDRRRGKSRVALEGGRQPALRAEAGVDRNPGQRLRRFAQETLHLLDPPVLDERPRLIPADALNAHEK